MAPTHTIPNLPPAVTFDVLHTLRTSLPPPAAGTEGSLEARIETAMAVVVAYHPADISEALLAAQIVAADAQAMDCLRSAVAPDADAETTRRCRGQAAAMMRLMQSGLRILQRTQAAREKAEAEMHPAAMERAGYWFHEVSVPELPAPLVPPEGSAEPVIDPVAEAKHYALIYPDRAALIRAHGGLPPRLTFGPPEPDIVAALVNGASPAIRAIAPHPAAMA
jgi:hypothetical protein